MPDAEAECSDDQLHAKMDLARTELPEQKKTVADIRAQRTNETLPQLEARVARLEKVIRDRRDKCGNLQAQPFAGQKKPRQEPGQVKSSFDGKGRLPSLSEH